MKGDKTMKTWMKVLLVTLLVGIPTIPLGQLLWQVPAGAMEMGPAPSGMQIAFLIGVSVFDGLAFGLGVAFLVFGYPLVQRLTDGSKTLAIAAQLSIVWFLVSWWPHSNLHRTIGADYNSLIAIEYGFHITLMIGGAIVAYAFVRALPRLAQDTTVPAKAELRGAEGSVTA
jgi:hypothetical protein